MKRETPIVTLDDIKQAQERIRGVATRTPLLRYSASDANHDAPFYLKLESLQPMGAFKLRGAYNKIASLTDEERRRGVITYSSGNHAQGVAYAARAMHTHATVVMPRTAPQIKIANTKAMGAEIVLVGPGSRERQQRAEQLAAEHGFCIVPPYNDEKIIAGQGTIALEILADLPDVATVLVPIGGGGLISGIAATVKLSGAKARVIGVEPALANDAQLSFRAGHVVEISAEQTTKTIADGLRTQSVGNIPFEHIQKYVDDVITVTEDEIREATRRIIWGAHVVAEPSGAVTAAAYFFHGSEIGTTGSTVAVVSGGNVEPAMLAEIMAASR